MQPEAYCFHRNFEPAGPAAYRFDRHYLLYAMEGSLRLEADGRQWTLPPARAALIAAGHPVIISILTRLVLASVLFAPEFMEAPANALSVFEISPLARELIRECARHGADDGPLTPHDRLLFQTLGSVARELALQPSPCALPSPKSPALARALELTAGKADSTPKFGEIARQTGQSPRALARRFSDELGMTWRQALRRIRMMRAVEALAGSDAPVTEIAFACGYNSLAAFNAAFRDLTGKTPGEYRRSFHT